MRNKRKAPKTHLRSGLINFTPSPWVKDDKNWFSANASLSYRIRRVYDHEAPEEFNEGLTHVLVRQTMPGYRERIFLTDPPKGSGFDSLPDIDEIGFILWEKLHDGSTRVCLNEIVRSARLMSMPGEMQ
ncbi:hypothetical protein [Nitrosomonas sp. Nm34]|uniref:hypothetical protein n=1 Tax=Nitrosomonas sp. Nm34 TaxID=1881055 RepID=UPI0008E9AC07|nr:hypothetical protein [Nitrosomonas sp. Nm34]SFI70811.1 hypothetical protein SAMN05428978_102829 [Nitrosomonas sp. Nm34]